MFRPIQTLNQRLFRQNKGRNMVAVLAIIMTTLMFTTLFVLIQSMNKNVVEMSFRQSGYDAQVSFKTITDAQTDLIEAHPDVKETGRSIVLGLAVNKELLGHQTEIRWADENYARHSFSFPAAGILPKAKDEIALDTTVLDRLGIPHEVGQKVELEWMPDLTSNETVSSSFILCGYWEGNESAYASMAWVSREYADEMIREASGNEEGQVPGMQMAQVNLYDDSNIEAVMDGILSDTGLSGLAYGVNLAYSPELSAQAVQDGLPMYLGMVLVFIAGYLIIYNIFQISVTADIQLYGKLKTLGTTARQIKKLIYGQANRLCVIGIPVGMALGYLLGMVLVPVVVSFNEGQVSVSANPVIFLGSALFAWLTVIISCLRPARLAGKVSPIEALRYSDAGTAGGKKSKKNRNGATIFAMAWSNLGRNKKRTITVICSLTFGLVLLSSFYAKNAAFDMEKYLADLILADFELADASNEDYVNGYNPQGTTLNEELIKQLEGLDGIEETGYLYSREAKLQLNDRTVNNLSNFYTEDRLKDWAAYDAAGPKGVQEAIREKKCTTVVYGADGIPLEALVQDRYLLDGSFDAGAFAMGDYILAVGPAVDRETSKETMPTYSVGDRVTIEGKEFTVMAVVYPVEPVTGGAAESSSLGDTGLRLGFILPADTFRSMWPENTLRKLYINAADEQLVKVQDMLDQYTSETDSSLSVTSRLTMTKQYIRETRSGAVMENTISIVIALVGVLNFVNSMITAIVSRKREFAMIQSIGTTKKQLQKMLIFEGLDYAFLTLAVSYIASALAVGIGVRAMTEGGFTTFRFTLLPLAVCTPILLLFAVLIPFICFRNLEKQSIVERLRME